MGCCNCEYLKEKDKKDGKVNGSVYFCSKKKSYVNGASDACDDYKKDIMRKSYVSDEIYKDGKKYYNDSTSISLYIALAIILVIAAIIVNVF